jgi:hypothetical protein
MPDAENTQIDSALSTDVGDETSNRFRYQWALSAIICCMLLDQDEDVEEVFCEHHEDILVKHINSLFTGIQVKTRASNQPLWKASDRDVVKAFARFVKLDNLYPRQFQAFKFITNHPIQSTSNGQDIAYLLCQISQSENHDSLSNVVKTFIKRISRTAEIKEEYTFHTLKKASIKHDLPKFRDVTMRLIDTIVLVWDKAEGASYEGIKRAASHLIDACFRASSLAGQDLLPAYLPVSSSGIEREIKERIAEKAFSKQRVYGVLLQGLDDTIPLSCDPMDSGKKAFIMGTRESALYLLILRDPSMVKDLSPGKSAAWCSLDAAVLQVIVFQKLLKLSPEKIACQENIAYTRDEAAALKTLNQDAQLIFLLNPTKISQIIAVASAGDKMPQKSTYFYPKLLTGLIINDLKG